MDYVRFQVALEVIEAIPLTLAVELVLGMAEELLAGSVVDAVAPAGHALGDSGLPQPRHVPLVLVLSSHVRVHGRRDAV